MSATAGESGRLAAFDKPVADYYGCMVPQDNRPEFWRIFPNHTQSPAFAPCPTALDP